MTTDYDLIVIGAGSAGITAVQFAATLGARVALVEKGRIGGDCTWTGCIPSKALLHVANITQAVRQCATYGITTTMPAVDMEQVYAYVQQTIQTVYELESPAQLTAAGIDLIAGAAHFINPGQIQVDNQQYTAQKFIIATGAVPALPPLPGLDSTPYYTYHSLFDNKRLPDHLLVIGAGAVGVEMAQAYRRLGAQVTVIDEALLPLEEPEASALLLHQFEQEGIELIAGLVQQVQKSERGISLTVNEQTVCGDMLLVATGRRPLLKPLQLKNAGIATVDGSIQVNNRLQTSQKHIYAAGDCLGSHQFTHFAGWQGYVATRNALLPGSSNGNSSTVPYAIFTEPNIARIGPLEAEARQRWGSALRVDTKSLHQFDRALTDDATAGFLKLLHHENGRILGATIVAPNAGELITEFALAMTHNLTVSDLANTMHVYPTYAIGAQRLFADIATNDFLNSRLGKMVQRFSGFAQAG